MEFPHSFLRFHLVGKLSGGIAVKWWLFPQANSVSYHLPKVIMWSWDFRCSHTRGLTVYGATVFKGILKKSLMNEQYFFTSLPSLFSSMTGVPIPFLWSICGNVGSGLSFAVHVVSLYSVASVDSGVSLNSAAVLHRYLKNIIKKSGQWIVDWNHRTFSSLKNTTPKNLTRMMPKR